MPARKTKSARGRKTTGRITKKKAGKRSTTGRTRKATKRKGGRPRKSVTA
jgi:hypothetical protein